MATAVWSDHRKTLARAREKLQQFTHAHAEHSHKSLEGADQAARFVRAEFGHCGPATDLAGYVKNQDIIATDYHHVGIIGVGGVLSHSSAALTRVNLGDREHFQAHLKGSADTLFISQPVLGKVSGNGPSRPHGASTSRKAPSTAWWRCRWRPACSPDCTTTRPWARPG